MSIQLRKANINDCDLLYYWVNDKEVRNNSFNKEKINYKEHKEWFEDRLYSKRTQIFILEEDELNIGQIRMDIEYLKGIIDYSIDKKYRGQKNGYRILNLLEHEIIINWPVIKILEGRVKVNNIPSQKCFEKNGYNKFIKKEYIVYTKKI